MRKHVLAIAAVVGVLAGSAAGVAAQDESSPAGLVTEDVEPGVERVISDDAGHDLDQKHPMYRYDMDQIAIAPDGTVWLSTTYSREDNEANPPGALVWALGRPGTVIDDVGGTLVALSDGTLLLIGDRVRRFEEGAFVPDDGPIFRSSTNGGLWILGPDQLSALTSEGEQATRSQGPVVARAWREGEIGTGRPAYVWVDGGWCATGSIGVTCEGRSGELTTYLAGTRINQIAGAPDGTVWAVGGYAGDNGGLYRITLD